MVTAVRIEHESFTVRQSSPLGCDFRRVTPLEFLSLGDRERIHTETLRWLLSSDSPLSPDGRVRLLRSLCPDLPQFSKILDAVTEYKCLDLVVKVGYEDDTNGHIVIENKLKSAEHSDQLRRYDEKIAAEPELTPVIDTFFMTLIGEPATSSKDWHPISYRRFYDSLLAEITAHPPVQSLEFLRDYRDLLSRLVGAVERVVASPDPYAAIVFGAGERAVPDAGFAKYVEKTRLKMILQRSWMLELGLRVERHAPTYPDRWSTGETRGNALITFHLAPILRCGQSVDMGVQVQSGQAKIFASPTGYAAGASADTHKAVGSVLGALADELGVPGIKRTSPHDKGFSSFRAPLPLPRTFGLEEWSAVLHELLADVAKARGAVAG